MDETAARTAAVAQMATRRARELAAQVQSSLSRTATALEHSAKLAEDHAKWHDRTGNPRPREKELAAASRAREASELARARGASIADGGSEPAP